MGKKKNSLKNIKNETQEAIDKTNVKIAELGDRTNDLYIQLTDIQDVFDEIRNVPSETKIQYEELKQVRLNWKQQAEQIDKGYNTAAAKNAGAGAAGVGVGVSVAALGPSAAMGVATTFGVASTGTAISELSGAAATNAALAWLGGGAAAAGGGGMAAGEAFLALAGPIGWAIAGVSLAITGVFLIKNVSERKRLVKIFGSISDRDIRSYDLAEVELNERIARIDDEKIKLGEAIEKIKTFGTNYLEMTEAQQYELGAYVNLMSADTQLLVDPILGLQPKYTETDYEQYLSYKSDIVKSSEYDAGKKTEKIKKTSSDDIKDYSPLIISLANLLYKIELDDKDQNILWNALRKNKTLLKSLSLKRKEFSKEIIQITMEALNYKYECQSVLENPTC